MISTEQKVKNLEQAINNDQSSTVFEISRELLKDNPNDQIYLSCYAISGIKAQKFEELSTSIFKQQPTSSLLNPLFYYFLYSSGQFEKSIQLLQKQKLSGKMKLLLAQSYFNTSNYEDCVKILGGLMRELKLSQQQKETYMIDILAASTPSKEASNVITQFSSLINQHSCKQLYYNYALALEHSDTQEQCLKYLNMFEGALTNEKQDEIDWITVRLFRDYLSMKNHESHSSKMWDEKIEQYEGMLKKNKDDNLRSVLYNNMLFLKALYAHQQPHSYKVLDEIMDPLKFKLSFNQKMILKQNKATLLLRKNKNSQALKLLAQIQNLRSEDELLNNFQYVRNKYYALKKNKQYQQIDKLITKVSHINTTLSFCLVADMARERNDQTKVLDLLKDSTNWKNDTLKNYIFSLLIKDQMMFEKYSNYLEQLASKSNQINILEILLKLYENKSDLVRQKDILNRILEINPKSVANKVKLAEIYLNEGAIEKGEELMRGIEMPDQITDLNYLQYIEKNIHISKKQQAHEQQDFKKDAHKKRIKKKKKVRLPKNMDKFIENYKGDPERWLPKWQRKGYKKKGGKKSNKTQGMATVGRQQKNTYISGTSTGNKQVTKHSKKRR